MVRPAVLGSGRARPLTRRHHSTAISISFRKAYSRRRPRGCPQRSHWGRKRQSSRSSARDRALFPDSGRDGAPGNRRGYFAPDDQTGGAGGQRACGRLSRRGCRRPPFSDGSFDLVIAGRGLHGMPPAVRDAVVGGDPDGYAPVTPSSWRDAAAGGRDRQGRHGDS